MARVALRRMGNGKLEFLGFVDGKGRIRKAKTRKVNASSKGMKTYDVYWGPEGRKIATVQAKTARAAKRKAPSPYRKYLGEIYVEDLGYSTDVDRKFFR